MTTTHRTFSTAISKQRRGCGTACLQRGCVAAAGLESCAVRLAYTCPGRGGRWGPFAVPRCCTRQARLPPATSIRGRHPPVLELALPPGMGRQRKLATLVIRIGALGHALRCGRHLIVRDWFA
jgi:hypothetical protein